MSSRPVSGDLVEGFSFPSEECGEDHTSLVKVLKFGGAPSFLLDRKLSS